jgi:four helix bundle suffix protein
MRDQAEQRHLRPSGGYRQLHSFQVTTVIYDATVSFCGRFVDSRSRTRDQMVQAARSGRQNIAEGSRASATSSQTELRLVNVARASLDELLLDYEDYLRQKGHAQWAKDSPEAMAVRLVGKNQSDRTDQSDPTDPYRPWLAQDNPAVVANAVICLIHQANYLLDRQIQALERQFVQQGGYREQLAAARLREREQRTRSDRTDRAESSDQTSAPACPTCGGIMAVRTTRKGPRAGAQFWGCAKYPACKGTKPL